MILTLPEGVTCQVLSETHLVYESNGLAREAIPINSDVTAVVISMRPVEQPWKCSCGHVDGTGTHVISGWCFLEPGEKGPRFESFPLMFSEKP
jgi:hypothetical protein